MKVDEDRFSQQRSSSFSPDGFLSLLPSNADTIPPTVVQNTIGINIKIAALPTVVVGIHHTNTNPIRKPIIAASIFHLEPKSANGFDPYLSAKSPSSAFSFLIFHPWGLHPGSPSPRTAAGAGSNLAPGIARYPLAPWPARQPALPIQQQGRRSCPGRCSRSARNQLSLFFSILREWEGEARTRLPATSARVAHRGLIEWRGRCAIRNRLPPS